MSICDFPLAISEGRIRQLSRQATRSTCVMVVVVSPLQECGSKQTKQSDTLLVAYGLFKQASRSARAMAVVLSPPTALVRPEVEVKSSYL